MQLVKVSIITVVYNDKLGLLETIQSVKRQTYKNLEYIVIDGGSNDGSQDIIRENEHFISKWISEPDNGIYDAMNKGIHLATGTWLNFLNAGDRFISEKSVEEIINNSYTEDIVYGSMVRFKGRYRYISRGMNKAHPTAFDFMHTSVGHQAAFIKSDVFDRVGLYDINYKLASDAKFFFDALIIHKIQAKYIDKPIVMFEIGGASTIHQDLYDEERQSFLINYMGEETYGLYEELYAYKKCPLAIYAVRMWRLWTTSWLKKILGKIKHSL